MPCTAAASPCSCHAGNVPQHRRGTDLVTVETRAAVRAQSVGRVEDQVDFPVQNGLHHGLLAVGSGPLAVLADRPDLDAVPPQHGSCAGRGQDLEPQIGQPLDGKITKRLSRLATETKTVPLVGSGPKPATWLLAKAVPKPMSSP